MKALRLLAGPVLVLAPILAAVATGIPVNSDLAFSFGAALRDTLPALAALGLAALASAWLATGGDGVRCGLAWLAGARDETRAASAARALASASRAALATGVMISIAALALLSAVAYGNMHGEPHPAPAFIARGVQAGLLPPVLCLLAGRCWLGAHAASAATSAGERHGRTLRGWNDVTVPVLLVALPALLLLSTLLEYPTTNR